MKIILVATGAHGKNTDPLYHLPDDKKKPHGNPQPNKRGLQIAQEFYKLAKEWLL
ncbi:MAG: hypothetical protein Q8R17_02895 [bacterium]|nr:hypothetical protein [bacterium]